MEREKKRGDVLGTHTLPMISLHFPVQRHIYARFLFARARKNRPYRAENQLPVQ